MTKKTRVQPGFPRGGRARKIWNPASMSISSKPTVHFDIGWRTLLGLAAIALVGVAVLGFVLVLLGKIHL